MDIDSFKSLILERQRVLLNLIAKSSTGTAAVELDQTKVGRLSRMDALQQQQMNLASERRRSRELVAIDSALMRIDQGSFGRCIECGEAIGSKRLEIDLAATLCIRCADAREKQGMGGN